MLINVSHHDGCALYVEIFERKETAEIAKEIEKTNAARLLDRAMKDLLAVTGYIRGGCRLRSTRQI